jgi:uncharacterized circularly permuted ATP-grasp superfamily protein
MRDDAWLARAVLRYHELCADPALAGPKVVTRFAQAQIERGLTFGGVVQCRSLRPAFLTRERLATLRQAVSLLWSAFRTLELRALADPSLAAELGLSADECALAAIDPGYDDATVVSRLDAYFSELPRVLEYNADSPAGMSYQAGQASLMRGLPVMSRFADEFRMEELRADNALRETLLGVWREFAARKGAPADAPPSVAILDVAEVATSTEFRLVRDDLEAHGVPALIVTPEDLSYEDGELRACGRRIDLVYKRLLVADFLARYDMHHPLVRAYAQGATCVASSFRCTIAHKKKSLGVLRDPARAAWFAPGERAAIAELVAQTYPYHSADRPQLEATRARWALKPNDAHGGENVTLGWECDDVQWRAALDAAGAGDYVVQERIEPVMGAYPVFEAGAPERGAAVRTLIEDCGLYIFRGSLGGVLTRLSDEAVINVSRGGQAIPTFIIEPVRA